MLPVYYQAARETNAEMCSLFFPLLACCLFLLSCQLSSAGLRCRGPQAVQRFLTLGLAVMAVCSISFGPFILAGQLPQVQPPCHLSDGCYSIMLLVILISPPSYFTYLVTCHVCWALDGISCGITAFAGWLSHLHRPSSLDLCISRSELPFKQAA